jgi:hypothetical protein
LLKYIFYICWAIIVKFYKIHGTKANLKTFGGKYDAGHLFHFVLRLMKGGAEMSYAAAVVEPTDIFRIQS